MLFSLLSGRLLEDITSGEETAAGKEIHTGMGSFRKQIEERKVENFCFPKTQYKKLI